jgi:hypothetical protein
MKARLPSPAGSVMRARASSTKAVALVRPAASAAAESITVLGMGRDPVLRRVVAEIMTGSAAKANPHLAKTLLH